MLKVQILVDVARVAVCARDRVAGLKALCAGLAVESRLVLFVVRRD